MIMGISKIVTVVKLEIIEETISWRFNQESVVGSVIQATTSLLGRWNLRMA